MKTRWLRFLLTLALIMLPLCALADAPQLHSAQVDLYTDGKFPTSSMVMAIDFDVNEFNETVYAGLTAQAEQIDVSSFGLTRAEFKTAYGDLINSKPELFYVSGSYRYAASDDIVVYFLPEYRYPREELDQRIAAFNAAVNRVVSYADRASTRVGKLLLANMYFCLNFEYDNSLTVHSPDQLFSSGTGVCQAYMLAFSAVLNKMGIPNTPATSTAMNHIWNMVQVDGSWYHIDVTWNDPVGSQPLNVHYNNFLLSHSGIMSTDHHSWSAQVTADNTKYDNAFWREMTMPLSISGSTVYYTVSDTANFTCTVKAHNLSSGNASDLFTYDVYYAISGSFNPLWVSGSRAYYTTGLVLCSSALDGSDVRVEYVCASPDEMIWRLYMENSTLKMFVSTGPYESGAVLPLTAQDIRLTLDQPLMELYPQEYRRIVPLLNGTHEFLLPVTFTADQDNIAVDENGFVIAYAPGFATATVTIGDQSAACPVIVHSKEALALPNDVERIEKDAFRQTAAEEIILPEGASSIGENAFADCGNLVLVTLPESLSSIDPSAFAGSDSITLLCAPGSIAEAFAAEQNIPVFLLPE